MTLTEVGSNWHEWSCFDLALLIIDVDVFCKGCRTRYLLNKLFVDQF